MKKKVKFTDIGLVLFFILLGNNRANSALEEKSSPVLHRITVRLKEGSSSTEILRQCGLIDVRALRGPFYSGQVNGDASEVSRVLTELQKDSSVANAYEDISVPVQHYK